MISCFRYNEREREGERLPRCVRQGGRVGGLGLGRAGVRQPSRGRLPSRLLHHTDARQLEPL